MRIRLFHKLFCVMVITSLASIALFGVTSHWYLHRNFTRFIDEQRVQHLRSLAEQLSEHYEEHGDWDLFRGQRRALRQFVARSDPDFIVSGRRPPRHRRQGFTLYDAEQQPVTGSAPFTQTAHALPITNRGRTVGWVGLPPFARRPTPPEARFARNQLQVLSIGAAVACLLSVLVAYYTARRLAAPIAAIGDGARALAGGQFELRLPPMGSDEIGQLADDFNVLARSLESHESTRRRWFADVSHELRTPLAVMRAEIEAVHDGIRGNDARLLGSLDQETRRLQQLIDDLYHLARADIGALEYEFLPCAPAAVARATVQRFSHRFAEAGLKCESDLDDSVNILADAQRLSQLLDNLLENCCRYVASPGTVRIVVRSIERVAELRVEDSGPGVADEQFADLFEPLTRGEQSRHRDHGGSGLGLAICKRIAEAHGGDIEAERTALGGLAVIVRVPLAGKA